MAMTDVSSLEARRRIHAANLADSLDAAVQALSEMPQVQRVLVFGSYARGRRDLRTDLDLLVVMDTDEGFTARLGHLYERLGGKLSVPYDVLAYTPDELDAHRQSGFLKRALREAYVLYERGQRNLPERPMSPAADPDPRHVEEGRRWLEQALEDMKWARLLEREGGFHLACFHAQQVAEKALKALLYAQGEESVREHSVDRLCRRVADRYPEAAEHIARWAVLDQFYIPTRYPNGLPPGVIPARAYNREVAQGALALTDEILAFVSARTPAD
jgi:HEPN domain-containing protein/predicted nucleotidyltransferase